MTLARGLALKISDAVVLYASPGCKEWAEGLAREVAFIESDWAALGWALGSTRVLLDRREMPARSLDDVYVAALKFIDLKRTGGGSWFIMFTQAFIYGLKLFGASTSLERVGCGLAILGAFSMGIYSRLEMRRMNALLSGDIEDNVFFYKAELERDLYHSPKWWITGSGFVFFVVGVILAQRGGIEANWFLSGLFTLTLVGVLLFALHTRRTNLRRLERLEELLAERSGAASMDRLG